VHCTIHNEKRKRGKTGPESDCLEHMEPRENNSPLSGICPIITEAMCHSQQHHSVNDADPWISPSLGKLHIGKKIMGNNQDCWRSRPVMPVKMLAIIVCRFTLQQKLLLLPVGIDSNV
jgi:hypothetical protein